MEPSKIPLSTFKEYLREQFKTQDVEIFNIETHKKGKIILSVLISGKKLYVHTITGTFRHQCNVIKKLQGITPKVILYDPSKKYFPHEIMLTEHAGECSLSETIINGEKIDFVSIGKTIGILHRVHPISGLEKKKIDKDKVIPNNYVARYLKPIKNDFPSLLHDVLKNLKHTPVCKKNMVVCHNDLSSDNIMMNNGCPSIIDFDEVGYNVKEFDLASLLISLEHPALIHKMQSGLSDYTKKGSMSIFGKNKVLRLCVELFGYELTDFYRDSLKKISDNVLSGYRDDLSPDLYAYCDRIIRLNNLVFNLFRSFYFPFHFDKSLLIGDLLQCSSASLLSKRATSELVSYIEI
ncbi:MAG: phosphotransferase [Candidatus Omnitrophota bacterium]